MNSLYFKSSIWDFVLVLLASLGMSYTLLNCFYVDPDLQHGPIPGIVCAVLLLVLFVLASDRRVARIGGPLFGVALVVSWIVAASLTPDGAYLVDNESNYLIFVMVTTLVPVACFLLSRKLAFAALLFIAGAFLGALVQFLYRQFDVVWSFMFVAAALALVVYKNYQMSLRTSTSVKKVAFAPGFAVALATTAVAVGLGCGIWFGVIAPLNPPAVEIKLLTEYRALETIRVKGIADIYQVPNLDMTSDVTNDDERTTDDIKESPDGRKYPATGNAESQDDPETADAPPGSAFSGVNINVPDDLFNFLNYRQVQIALIITALLVIGGIVAYFVGRRRLRARRLSKLQALPPAEQAKALYPFFVQKFERLGMAIAPGQTLADYTVANAATMQQFDEAAGTAFADLTQDYVAAAYGKQELGPDTTQRYADYYNAFWKACRHKLGSFRYFFKSFRL